MLTPRHILLPLRRARDARLTVRVVVTDASGNATRRSLRVQLRR